MLHHRERQHGHLHWPCHQTMKLGSQMGTSCLAHEILSSMLLPPMTKAS
uniref:Protein SCAR2-like isoform X2 n=1 Tax=Rhizophora mucronata TaxID=61149 RepID=A0A2P2JGQ5_RHIMU